MHAQGFGLVVVETLHAAFQAFKHAGQVLDLFGCGMGHQVDFHFGNFAENAGITFFVLQIFFMQVEHFALVLLELRQAVFEEARCGRVIGRRDDCGHAGETYPGGHGRRSCGRGRQGRRRQ